MLVGISTTTITSSYACVNYRSSSSRNYFLCYWKQASVDWKVVLGNNDEQWFFHRQHPHSRSIAAMNAAWEVAQPTGREYMFDANGDIVKLLIILSPGRSKNRPAFCFPDLSFLSIKWDALMEINNWYYSGNFNEWWEPKKLVGDTPIKASWMLYFSTWNLVKPTKRVDFRTGICCFNRLQLLVMRMSLINC